MLWRSRYVPPLKTSPALGEEHGRRPAAEVVALVDVGTPIGVDAHGDEPLFDRATPHRDASTSSVHRRALVRPCCDERQQRSALLACGAFRARDGRLSRTPETDSQTTVTSRTASNYNDAGGRAAVCVRARALYLVRRHHHDRGDRRRRSRMTRCAVSFSPPTSPAALVLDHAVRHGAARAAPVGFFARFGVAVGMFAITLYAGLAASKPVHQPPRADRASAASRSSSGKHATAPARHDTTPLRSFPATASARK